MSELKQQILDFAEANAEFRGASVIKENPDGSLDVVYREGIPNGDPNKSIFIRYVIFGDGMVLIQVDKQIDLYEELGILQIVNEYNLSSTKKLVFRGDKIGFVHLGPMKDIGMLFAYIDSFKDELVSKNETLASIV